MRAGAGAGAFRSMAGMDSTSRPRVPRADPRLVALAEDSGYRIGERIGAGGMGIVYRASDADHQDVAIKLLRHDIADDPRARQRLAREVAAQRSVRNENIVRILDAELESSEAFVVTEFVPGPTLEDAVIERGGLHPEAVREIGTTLGETLRVIHEAGVIHRDLKPSNVLLRGAEAADLDGFDPEGNRLDPVIIDFGIAVAAEESRLTSTGLVMGTAAYLDPEVVRTNSTAAAGDWWAWAAVLAFAATGRPPFGTGRADLVFLRAERGEIDVEGVPTELDAWLRDALQADPAARPDPEELIERLAGLDLERYDDAGETQALDTQGRTAAFPAGAAAGAAAGAVAGAAAAGATTPLASAAAATDEDDLASTQAMAPILDEDDDAGPPTAAMDPMGEERTRALDAERAAAPDPDRTQALPPIRDEEGRTEALPPIRDDADRTQALPATPAPDPTEALPAVGPATTPMPVVRAPMPQRQQPTAGLSGPPPQQAPAQGYAPARPAPQGYPQQGRPAPQGYPPQQQGYPPQGYAPQQRPVAPPPGQQMTPHPGYPGQQPGQAGPWPAAAAAPKRTLLVWAGNVLLIALGALAPYVALTALLLLGALARTWERSHRAVENRRFKGATGSGPRVQVGFAAPFRFLWGLVETALQALLPLILGLVVGIAVDAIAWLGLNQALPDGVAFGTAMAVTVLVTWVGLGSRTTRHGAHRVMDAAAPDRTWTAVLGVLLLLMIGAVIATILARQGMVDYFPFAGGFRLEDVAVWRL